MDKSKTTVESEEAISLLKPVTDLVNHEPALVTERPAVGNEKLNIHLTKLVSQ